ncbi:MAG: sigma-70 family RNA polymerase sigma factor, partial [Proteobacteria bacterium]|nr:sigma-70 family RNA polymerase sigma factor [Pseudomonadota bacterium]
ELAALHPKAWAWAAACCRGDRQSAHDVLHDAYLQILGGRAAFDGRSSFKTWVFGVIRMVAMATRRRRLLRGFLFEPIGPVAERVAAPDAAPRAPPRLLAAMRALPRRQNEIITLVFAHDLTLEEAACVMNISVGAARQHHARAKQKLRAALIDLGTSHE